MMRLIYGHQGIFAGGDVVLGPKTVTEAMSHGKIAAEMIDKYIKGEELMVGNIELQNLLRMCPYGNDRRGNRKS